MPFDPAFPPTFNSLNRFKIWELEGFPNEKVGWAFYDLVSSHALSQAIIVQAESLAINPAEQDLHAVYFQRLAAADDAAIAIAQQMGRYFGFMLVALKRGDALNRQKNAEKDAAYWDYWSQVDRVFLGGGLSEGEFGRLLVSSAQAILQQYALDVQLSIAAYPRSLGLLGAARHVSTGEQALVLDFGSTRVKRGRAFYSDAGLQQVQVLPSIPAGFDVFVAAGQEQAIFERFVALLVDAYQPQDADLIPVSISAYVTPTGQPVLTQSGIYMHMSHLSDDLPALLSETVSQRVGRSVAVKLLHDGSAAASTYAPLDHAVVITLGTAIGSGYPVMRPGLRPLTSDFTVTN
ncbi:MAG: hypothetical protein CL607_10680 [Anaerolineaceae bacterium]|nr:hypothetical protein [Anaerolineaceae bacterium]